MEHHPIEPVTLWERFSREWARLGHLPPSQDPRILDRRRRTQYPWTNDGQRSHASVDAGEDAAR